MLQLQPTSPYTPRVEVPDTTRSFLRLGVSSPRRNQTYKAWLRIAPGLFSCLMEVLAILGLKGAEQGL